MERGRWIVVVVLALLVPQALALEVPPATGFVNDAGQMLDPQERSQLESLLRTISQNSTVEIAVLTLQSLEDEDLEEYANRVFREWGVGKEDVDNGILILVSRDDRRIRIEVGYGLEGVITDAVAGLIIRNRIAPAFREERYIDGLAQAAADIHALASGDPATVSAYNSPTGYRGAALDLSPLQMAALPLLLVAYIVFVIDASVKYKKDRKRKQKVKLVGYAIVVVLAFLFGTTVGFLIALVCLWLLLIGSGGLFFFGPFGGFGGGGHGGFGGGGFGGFGGGGSGGGGSSGGW